MNFDTPKTLAALPDRLSALILDQEDAVIDAQLAEAAADTGLFDGMVGPELVKQRYLYRFRLFAEELVDLIEDADGTTEEYRRRQQESQAEIEEWGEEEAARRSIATIHARLAKRPDRTNYAAGPIAQEAAVLVA